MFVGSRIESPSFRISQRAILFTNSGELLLVEDQKGRLVLPGGGIEEKEQSPTVNLIPVLEHTVLWRELEEELGVTKELQKMLRLRPSFPVAAVEWFRDASGTQLRLDMVRAIHLGNARIEVQPNHPKIIKGDWFPFFTRSFPENMPGNTIVAIQEFKKKIRGDISESEAKYGGHYNFVRAL